VRLPSVLDVTHLPLAEQCAVRLDGDGFALGDGIIAADEPDGPAQRAASLAGAASALDLVLGGWSAAWVHGATDRLRRPLDLQLGAHGEARTKRIDVRAVVLDAREVERLGGVRVTTPFRTATDLARREARLDPESLEALRTLIRLSRCTWPQAVGLLAGSPASPGKGRALARFRALRDGSVPR